ncbi:hypothetical protein [Saccharothrix syringae]|uniref:Uncharacterized protein n=1 Tax=Saccharothrix syringae TaxID=103733 RepID=A0A5Q0GXD9_SACSY|nr:hypothetical protein [Saccharothrix syringae]QFZ18727.1 hypothetical protein EKG83_15820 [Saccharothrix syringae]
MTTKVRFAQLVAAAGVGVAGIRAARRAMSGHRDEGDAARDRWLVVTVLRAPNEVVSDGSLPAPLAELGDLVEVRVRPAPGDKGTELAARLTRRGPTSTSARVEGEDPRQRVRTALREAKSILEVGEIVRPDAPPTTHPGPAGRLVSKATHIAQGEGRL